MDNRLWKRALSLLLFSVLLSVTWAWKAEAATSEFKEYGDFSSYTETVYEEDVVYAYLGTTLVKTDIQGQVLWSFESKQGEFTGKIGLYGDYLSVGTSQGAAYFLNPNNGKKKQSVMVPTGGYSVTGAFIGEDGLIYAIADRYFYLMRPNGTFISRSYHTFHSNIIELGADYAVVGNYNLSDIYWVNLADFSAVGNVWLGSFESIDKKNNKLYKSSGNKLHAYQLNNGRELWSKEFTSGAYIDSASAGPDGTIYVGMESGGFYAVDPVTRDVKRQFNEGSPRWGQAAADAQGNVYVVQRNQSVDRNYLVKFSKTGQVLEMNPVSHGAFDLVVRKDGSLYYTDGSRLYSSKDVPVSEGNIPKDDGQEPPVQPQPSGLEFKKTGQFGTYSEWHYTDDAVYAYDNKGLVKAKVNGEILWEVPNKGGGYSGQINLFDGELIVGSENGSVYVINPANGAVKETYTVPTNGYDIRSAYKNTSGNMVAVTSYHTYEVKKDSSVVQKASTHASYVLKKSNDYVIMRNYYFSEVYWINPYDLSSTASEWDGYFEAMDDKNNRMYRSSGNKLIAYQLNNGRELWSKEFSGGTSINAVAAGPDGTIYVGMKSGNFYAVDPMTRDIKWQFSEGNPDWGRAVVDAKGNIHVGQSNTSVGQHYLFTFTAEGQKKDIARIQASAYDLSIRPDNSLYFIRDNNYYTSEAPVPEKPVSPPANDGFTEWEHKKNTPLDKIWDVTYNLAIDVTTIREKNIYITDSTGKVVPALYIIDRSRNDSKLSIMPVSDYTKGETYTLWIKNVKSEDGKVLKENVKMKFTIMK